MSPEAKQAAGYLWHDGTPEAFERNIEIIQQAIDAATAGRQAAEWQIVDYGESIGRVLQQGDDELAVLDTNLSYAKASRLRDLHNAATAKLREVYIAAKNLNDRCPREQCLEEWQALDAALTGTVE
jgi:hypothetical protein